MAGKTLAVYHQTMLSLHPPKKEPGTYYNRNILLK